MSNLILSAPVRQSWNWRWPMKKTPVWSNIVQTPASGLAELRIPLYLYPRWQFELDVDYIRGNFSDPQSAIAQLIGFWMSVKGSADDWLYEDPYDSRVSQMQFGTGDGVTTVFQLGRSIGGGTDVIQNLNGTPAIYSNYAPVSSADYSIGSTGIVTFNTAPVSGVALSWTGGFYFRCRFQHDAFDALSQDLYEIWSLHQLKFISVLLPSIPIA